MRSTTSAIVACATTLLALATADSTSQSCSPTSPCPSDAPCCSQYGQCGTGAYCLGGCDIKSSFDLNSCMAAPVCQSGDFLLNTLDDIAPNTEYLGDSSKANWVSSGTPIVYQNNSMLLTMPANSVGTLLTSTHYVWYGKVSATMTTSQGAGVVTAFILMSDVKDEIDYEFVGTDLVDAQSNFYWQGVLDYHNSANLSVSNTRENYHTYTFDWTPDSLTWGIDGTNLRTLNRNDTYNATDGTYRYPQTPSRIQLSLWPAGASSSAPGTIAWAGGPISWNSPYMQNGYYYSLVKEVTVDCYNPPSGFSNNFGNKAYYYTSREGTKNTVAIGNNNTVLASLYASGNNPSYNPDATTNSSSTASSAPSSSATAANLVPGVVGTGAESAGSGQGGSSGGSSGSGSGSSGTVGFVQGSSDTSEAPKLAAGSAVALLAFFIAALIL